MTVVRALVASFVAQAVTARIPHVTVAPDVELLRKALLALRPPALSAPVFRWVLVKDALGHGAGVAQEVCRALQIDPDEKVEGEVPEWLEGVVLDG